MLKAGSMRRLHRGGCHPIGTCWGPGVERLGILGQFYIEAPRSKDVPTS